MLQNPKNVKHITYQERYNPKKLIFQYNIKIEAIESQEGGEKQATNARLILKETLTKTWKHT